MPAVVMTIADFHGGVVPSYNGFTRWFLGGGEVVGVLEAGLRPKD
jgi:hypothetical protein